MKAAHSFMAGGGEMGARIRALDWSETPLGPSTRWPQSLRSALSILLPSKAQIALCWGEQFITLYNDAYLPVFGAKHPRALGKPISEAWDELWRAGLKELFEGVVETGEAFWARDRPFFMERYGYVEETYFDVSYDPVRDESGRVGGLFCIVSDTTGRVLGDRRLRTLRDLAKAVQELRTVDEVLPRSPRRCSRGRRKTSRSRSCTRQRRRRRRALWRPRRARTAPPRRAACLRAHGWRLAAGRAPGRRRRRRARGRSTPVPGPSPCSEVAVLPLAGTASDEPLRPSRRRHQSAAPHRRRLPRLPAPRRLQHRQCDRQRPQIGRRAPPGRKPGRTRPRQDRLLHQHLARVPHAARAAARPDRGGAEDRARSRARSCGLAYRNGRRLLRLVNGLLDFARIQAGRLKAHFVAVDLPRLTARSGRRCSARRPSAPGSPDHRGRRHCRRRSHVDARHVREDRRQPAVQRDQVHRARAASRSRCAIAASASN